MDEINERTTAYLTVAFKDKTGAAAAPASATYSVACQTTGTAIRASTALTPASSIEIPLTTIDTAIVNSANARERRIVTVRAVYGASDECNDKYEFDVLNLSGV